MAQPTYLIQYIAAMTVNGGEPYLSADIFGAYPTANILMMKTEGVKVSISGTDMFDVGYDDVSYIEPGHSYVFSKECTIAIGSYKAVT